VVDMGPRLQGWAGRTSEDINWQLQKAIAHRRSTEVEKHMKDLKKASEELVFENKQLKKSLEQYKQATEELRENLQDVNLSNARLLYTNRVLRNTSLNERQRSKIADAISKAGSVTEAKTIYHTLENATPSAIKAGPQSLSEAIGRRGTSVIRASRKESTSFDPIMDRMKRLAGIK
jgi:predicted nuclease with TOPRIM domain